MPMATLILIVVSTLLAMGLFIVWLGQRRAARVDYIRTYKFPPGLFDKLQEKRPSLDGKQFQLVARGLRQFFLAYNASGCSHVSMPSQVADDLWHEFILYTRHYQVFCRKAFGRFMHHTPAVVLGADQKGNTGLRRVWWFACREENINPSRPTRLPLLFALDAKLGIADGFHYSPDCSRVAVSAAYGATIVHCGGDFQSTSFDGTNEGFGCHGGGSGDGGGGGGDGGSCGGCGGCGS